MARLEQEAPELTRRGRRLFGGESAIGFLSTGARNARPRIAPVSPIFALHDLYLSIEKDTPKRFDLLNDGRYMLHAFLGKDDEEFQVPGKGGSGLGRCGEGLSARSHHIPVPVSGPHLRAGPGTLLLGLLGERGPAGHVPG